MSTDLPTSDNDPFRGLDEDSLREFLGEAGEGLDTVSRLLIDLEQAPDNVVLINAIFRPIHSLKGTSSFFGFHAIQSLSHELETLLDLMRKKLLRASPSLIQLLLECMDALKVLVARIGARQGGEPDSSSTAALIGRIRRAAQTSSTVTADTSVWSDLIDKLDGVRRRLPKKDHSLLRDIEAILASVRILAPRAAGDDRTGGVPAEALTLLARLRPPIEGRLSESDSRAALSLLETLLKIPADDAAHAVIRKLIDSWHKVMNSAVGFDNLLRSIIVEKLDALIARQAWPAPAPAPAPAATGPTEEPPTEWATAYKTMRVSETAVDGFLGFVGKLILVGNMFRQLEFHVSVLDESSQIALLFRRVNEMFTQLSADLQKSILAIRKVPVHVLLQKIPRLVRDLASHEGKEIGVEMRGLSVEVDKSLLDHFEAPIIHLVRNAIDHGIEAPDVRLAAGKPRKGIVRVVVEETETHVVLTMEDDGKGLDLAAIRRKAEAAGGLTADQPLDEAGLIDIICRPGFSTAATVTEVSGRGVGLDVVRRAITDAGGSLSVGSVPGQGCTFRLRIPHSVVTLKTIVTDRAPPAAPLLRRTETQPTPAIRGAAPA